VRYLLKIIIFISSLSSYSILNCLYADELIIKGDNLKINEGQKRYSLSGNVSAIGDDFVLLADSLEILSLADMEVVSGRFYFLGESLIARCTKAEILKKLEIKRFYNLDGIVLKLHYNPQNYIFYDKNLLFDLFEYTMRLKAAYLRQVYEDRFYARDVVYTLCNCSKDNTWELSSHSVYYEKDKFLLSLSNIVYFYGVPIFYIPAILAPVGERRSGFLMPEPGFNSSTGYSIKTAYFQTLGVSADTTLYFTMMSRKGEMYSLEFRYMPFYNLYGKMMLSYVNGNLESAYNRRFSLKNEHRYDYDSRFMVGFSTNIVSDSLYMNDFLFDFWERNTEYTISRFYAGLRKGFFLMSINSDFYQNFKKAYKSEEFNFFSESGLAESQILPHLEITMLPKRFFYNTDVTPYIDYVNYYSFSYDLRKTDYFLNPLIVENDKREILSFQRFVIDLPIHNYQQIKEVLNLNQGIDLSVRNYQLPYTSYNFATSLYSLRLDMEFFRSYSFFKHILEPFVEYKNLFYGEYTKDNKIYRGRTVIKDEKDNYLKSRYILLHLNNHIFSLNHKEILNLGLAQGYQEVVKGDFTPLIFQTKADLSFIRFSGEFFYYWNKDGSYLDMLPEVVVNDKRGDSLSIKYQKIKNYLENPYIIFNEEFPYYLPAYYKMGVEDISTNLNIALSREFSCGYFITYSIERERLLFHGGGLYYHSRCNCLNAYITLVMYEWYEFPSFMINFNLGSKLM